MFVVFVFQSHRVLRQIGSPELEVLREWSQLSRHCLTNGVVNFFFCLFLFFLFNGPLAKMKLPTRKREGTKAERTENAKKNRSV